MPRYTEEQKKAILKLEASTRERGADEVITVGGPDGQPQQLLISYLRHLADAVRQGVV